MGREDIREEFQFGTKGSMSTQNSSHRLRVGRGPLHPALSFPAANAIRETGAPTYPPCKNRHGHSPRKHILFLVLVTWGPLGDGDRTVGSRQGDEAPTGTDGRPQNAEQGRVQRP